MSSLISKDESLNTSSVYVGYLILDVLKRSPEGRASLYDLAASLRKKGIYHSRAMIFGMSLLFATGVIDFKEPYFELND